MTQINEKRSGYDLANHLKKQWRFSCEMDHYKQTDQDKYLTRNALERVCRFGTFYYLIEKSITPMLTNSCHQAIRKLYIDRTTYLGYNIYLQPRLWRYDLYMITMDINLVTRKSISRRPWGNPAYTCQNGTTPQNGVITLTLTLLSKRFVAPVIRDWFFSYTYFLYQYVAIWFMIQCVKWTRTLAAQDKYYYMSILTFNRESLYVSISVLLCR